MISRTVTAIFLAVNLTNSLTVNLRWGRGWGEREDGKGVGGPMQTTPSSMTLIFWYFFLLQDIAITSFYLGFSHLEIHYLSPLFFRLLGSTPPPSSTPLPWFTVPALSTINDVCIIIIKLQCRCSKSVYLGFIIQYQVVL